MIEAALVVACGIAVAAYFISVSISYGFKSLIAARQREAQDTRDRFDDVRIAAKVYVAAQEDHRRGRDRYSNAPGWITKEQSDREAAAFRAAGGRVIED